jgi:hypothetical protein
MTPWLSLYITVVPSASCSHTRFACDRYPWDESAHIAVRVCKEVTGAATTPLREIVFSLFEEGVYDAWRDAAEYHLGPALDEMETRFDQNDKS